MRHLVALGAFAAVTVGCAGDTNNPGSPAGPPDRPSASFGPDAPIQAGSRKDTPWQRMTDADLAAEVARAIGRVIIGLKDSTEVEGVDNTGRVGTSATSTARAKDRLKAGGMKFDYEFRQTPVVVATIRPDQVVQLRRDPYVDYIEPSVPGSWPAQVIPWNVSQINAPQSWPLSTGSGVKLLILDSGVQTTHRDLVVPVAWRCISGPAEDFVVGHGTFVAGVAAARNNALDVIGTAYNATLWSANVTGTDLLPNAAETACSIELARVNGIAVVNMSIDILPSTAVTDQINAGYTQNNIVFVAAAGNTFGGPVSYPARLPNVVAVTATDANNIAASFAAVGPEIDLAAPGVAVLSTSLGPTALKCPGTFIATCSGTSFAAPAVSAAAALLKSRYPGWTNTQIVSRLKATATDRYPPGFDNTYGNGLLNVLAALQMSATIQGPVTVSNNFPGTWTVAVAGQVPFTYQWRVNGALSGTASSFTYQSTVDFQLSVTVTDALNQTATNSVSVHVLQCTPPLLIC